jgi:hypothetical protein
MIEAVERRVMFSAAAVGPEFQVNSFTPGDQTTYSDRAVATDANGNFAVTWRSYNQDGSGWGVYAQRYNAAGAAQGGEFRVNTVTAGDQSRPVIAMDSAGDFIVAWTSTGQDGSGDGIYAQRFHADGSRIGVELRANTSTAGNQWDPSVAMDGGGNFVIAWTSNGQDPRSVPNKKDSVSDGVYAQRFNADGTRIGGEFRVNTYFADSQQNPAVATDPAGDFVVAWQSLGQDGDNWGVYAQRYNAAGSPQGGEFRLNAYTTSSQLGPVVSMDGLGNFVAVWESFGQDGSMYGVFARRFTAAGAARGVEFEVNSYALDQQLDASVAVAPDGGFAITWQSNGQDGSGYGIYAQQYDAFGAALGGNFQVNSFAAGDQTIPSVAVQPNGEFVILWASSGQDGSGSGVYARLFQNG